MPLPIASFFVPRNSNTWYVVEDKYIKGGLQVVADVTTRNAINALNLKIGMLAITQSDNKLWQLISTGPAVWVEYFPSTNYNPFYTYKQTLPSDTWTISHTKNCRYFTYSVYDSTGVAVIPDKVSIVSLGVIELLFNAPISGHATFAFDLQQT